MLQLIVLVFVLWVLARVVANPIQRAKFRPIADRIITGEQSATEADIDKCITAILRCNGWPLGKSEADRCRVTRLRDIRNGTATPKG